MEATAKGQFYASRYEAERLEDGLKKKKWYITEGGPDFSIYESKDGGKVKFSKLAHDAYDGFNIEIIKATDPAALAEYFNEIGNVDIAYLIELSGQKGRVQFARHFMMSRRTVENWFYGGNKPQQHMIYLLEMAIRAEIERETQ